MKILLHGYTYTPNYGDILFSKMFYNECRKLTDTVDFISSENKMFSMCDTFRNELSYNNKISFREAMTYDALVIQSGGMFGQMFMDNTAIRFCRFIFPILCFLAQNKPVYILGVGDGYLNTRFIKSHIRHIMSNASVVTVRNPNTRQHFIEYGVDGESILTTSDTAHTITHTTSDSNTILVHCCTGLDDVYKKHILPSLQYLCGYDLLFVADDGFDVEHSMLADYGKCINFKSTDDLTERISTAHMIISNKLHVPLVGATLGKSVVVFPYNKKVNYYFDYIGEGDRCVHIKDLYDGVVERTIARYIDTPILLDDSHRVLGQKNLDIIKTIKPGTNTTHINIIELFKETAYKIGFCPTIYSEFEKVLNE